MSEDKIGIGITVARLRDEIADVIVENHKNAGGIKTAGEIMNMLANRGIIIRRDPVKRELEYLAGLGLVASMQMLCKRNGYVRMAAHYGTALQVNRTKEELREGDKGRASHAFARAAASEKGEHNS